MKRNKRNYKSNRDEVGDGGEDGPPSKRARELGDRREYLHQLANEFRITQSLDAKRQVLANLANFAYDPINYRFLREAKVIDIFLECTKCDNTELVRFACGGICNLCIDPINAAYIVRNGGIKTLIDLLRRADPVTLQNVIASLIYLTDYDKHIAAEVLPFVSKLKNYENQKLSNLVKIYMNDFGKSD